MCLLRAGQRRRAGDAAKSGQFRGQFSWVTGDPMGVKGLKRKVDFSDFYHVDIFAYHRFKLASGIAFFCDADKKEDKNKKKDSITKEKKVIDCCKIIRSKGSKFYPLSNFCIKPYVPVEPLRDSKNRRLFEHGI